MIEANKQDQFNDVMKGGPVMTFIMASLQFVV